MAPTIHLMRHAQGYHNLSKENEQLPDPDLTPLGLQQCSDLRALFPHSAQVRLVISSPLRRTLHTGINVLGRDDLYPILALDTLQEVSTSPCDTGSDVEVLRKEFGNERVDLRHLSPNWEYKGTKSPFQPDLQKLEKRARKARQTIRELAGQQNDDHIVVVTHGDFLHFLTNDWEGVPELDFYVWKNCEYRSYHFQDPDQDVAGNCRLVETPSSWERRRGSEPRPSLSQQKQWRNLVYKRLQPIYAAMGLERVVERDEDRG